MSLEAVASAVSEYGLTVLGAFHVDAGKTLVLLGPEEPSFWGVFQQSHEYSDGAKNPLDRYSLRTINAVAKLFDAEAAFPFGGPPYYPFLEWAKRGGQVWSSPVGLLVHKHAGLFVSFRGAIIVPQSWTLPEPMTSPCDNCANRPCLSACPAAALDGNGYDVSACHRFLNQAAGDACLKTGCAVRRACPVGQGNRQFAQSAFHMRAFHKG